MHPVETHKLGEAVFQSVNGHLQTKGLKIGNGTIVDAVTGAILHAEAKPLRRSSNEVRMVRPERFERPTLRFVV